MIRAGVIAAIAGALVTGISGFALGLSALAGEIDYEVPLGRELGGWVALVAALGVGAGSVLALRARRR